MHSGGVPVPASPLLLILPTDHQMDIWLLRIGKELHMSKQAKKSKKSNEAKVIKPFYVYLEGEKIQITKKMIDESPREVIEVYRNILWAQEAKERRRKRCRNANGTICKENCAECERVQRINLNDPCNGLPLYLEDMEKNGVPMPASNTFLSPEEYVIKIEEREELYAAIDTLDDKKQTVFKLHMEELSDHEIAARTGIAQTTVSYRMRTGVKKLKKIMKR